MKIPTVEKQYIKFHKNKSTKAPRSNSLKIYPITSNVLPGQNNVDYSHKRRNKKNIRQNFPYRTKFKSFFAIRETHTRNLHVCFPLF